MFKLSTLLFTSMIFLGRNFSQITTVNGPDHKLTNQEKSDGWQVLFDGKTTTGWHTYGMPVGGKAWIVKDGALCVDAENKNLSDEDARDLVTNEEYDNFDLKLDWKISPKGNSGIIFYVHEDSTKFSDTWNTGMEMQILDNGTPTRRGHPDAIYYTHRAGDLYDMMASKEVAKPQGEWNQIEIKSINGKLDFYMNGEHTLSTNMWDENWRQMIAISKFKNMPGFGTFKKGKIALQDHDGNAVCFRNIRIKRL